MYIIASFLIEAVTDISAKKWLILTIFQRDLEANRNLIPKLENRVV